jgi:2-polyprenyl-3-methyl-5-hydroxy-6-metoxy-1,4-benzoquinol methylase
MEKIITAINNNSWKEALELFLDYTSENKLGEEACIIGATILEHFDDTESLFDMIQTGLKINLFSYELYILLGNYYGRTNPEKAYLCYENALFYALKSGSEDDIATIKQIMANYKETTSLHLRNVIILVINDGEKKYLDQCLKAISENCFSDCYNVITLDINSFEDRTSAINNAVLNVTDDNDIFLLRSDVILTPNALFNLRLALYDRPEIAASSCVSNYAHYYQVPLEHNVNSMEQGINYAISHNIPMSNPYERKCAVDADFILIKKDIIAQIFPLDDYLLSDGFLFTELGLNIVTKGYSIVACWNSFVYRHKNNDLIVKNASLLDKDQACFTRKWGFSSEYYMGIRTELADMIRRKPDDALNILEIGAGLGTTLLNIQYRYPNATVKGIELVDKIANIASNYCDIECANIENYKFNDEEKYDYIICGDVLEHLVDPYALVDRLKNNLKPNGCIIASIPNLLDADVIYNLLHGYFNYEESGVLDRTHLRFFTKD